MGYSDNMVYTVPKLWDILGKNYGIYWAKTVGYIWQKQWIYWVKTMGYIGQKLLDIFGKNNGYIG